MKGPLCKVNQDQNTVIHPFTYQNFNIFVSGTISLPCTPGLEPSTVFQYLVINANLYNLNKVRVTMKSPDPTKMTVPEDYLLTYSYSTKKEPVQITENWRTRRETTEYDGNVTLQYCKSESDDVLNLPFFVILANKKEFYPRPNMLTSVSSLRRSRQRTSSVSDLQQIIPEENPARSE